MKLYRSYKMLIALVFITTGVSAQYITVDDTYTAQQLVENVLLNNQCASVSNVSVTGWTFNDGGLSYGYFNGNGSSFPFQDGIILSTGRAARAVGPNTSLQDEGSTAWEGDRDLELALSIDNSGNTTVIHSVNATVLEFDFIPLTNTISFDYMLSSEEYHDNAPCRYSDGFAFLLRESSSNGAYTNLAVVPGSDIPVKVTSVRPYIPGSGGCEDQNAEYFDAFNGREHPTNFNGQTKVLKAVSAVIPGRQYHIKLVIADETNPRYDSAIFLGGGSFHAEVDFGPNRLLATNNPLCNGEEFEMDATTSGAVAYRWYKNNTLISGVVSPTYTVDTPGTYKVEVEFTPTCSAEGEVVLEYAAPLVFGSYTLLQCDDNNDGLTAYNLQQAGILARNGDTNLEAVGYYLTRENADNNIDAITNITNYANTTVNQAIYVRIKNQYGCHGVAEVILSTSGNTVSDPLPLENCDIDGTDDGFSVFDLTQFDSRITNGLPSGVLVQYYILYNDALTFANAITNPENFTNTTAYRQTLYARISQGSECYGIAEAEIIVRSFGSALDDEDVTICLGAGPVTLDPGSYASYSWNTSPPQLTQQIEITEAGTYTVTVSNAYNCTGTKTYHAILSGVVSDIQFDINDFRGGNNSLTVIPTGIGSYQYSIDGINYQELPVFDNLDEGLYRVYVKDMNWCGVASKEVYILDYPKFFTPNSDNVNDYWRIKFLRNRPGVLVKIFDRYGKIITSFSGNAVGWDGTLNGKNLPATDYWFVITLENGRTVKGHFSLIR